MPWFRRALLLLLVVGCAVGGFIVGWSAFGSGGLQDYYVPALIGAVCGLVIGVVIAAIVAVVWRPMDRGRHSHHPSTSTGIRSSK